MLANCESSIEPLAKQAYELVRHQVLHGELGPGTIVSERLLAERLQLGKAPIRAAVQRLALEGFITIEPRRGIVISPQSIQDIIDLYEVRCELEQLVVRQLAGKLTEDQIRVLTANLQEHQSIAEKSDPVSALSVDFEFHRLLCEFHGNKHLTTTLSRIYDRLFSELRLSHEKSPERASEAVREHRAVVDALITGGPEEAEQTIARHLGSCQEFVMYRGTRNVVSSSTPLRS